ncbi:MAG: hypothetical protein EWV58_03030 [Microcystis aeruginosa Ma_MB_F_20061100_S19]|nr:MAG: hypothetical protein EWV59_22805 [Microcystis aeruginosa Ma_MB_F_20061100_S19D]TRU18028.1 MAG: hypothetical protein EWV58_03030 [Microcystis aeruginosa Ma_MB_F_20061100_S19]
MTLTPRLLPSNPPYYELFFPLFKGGWGGSNLKSIFNLIITSYLGWQILEKNQATTVAPLR